MFSKRAVLVAIVLAALGAHATRSALAQTWVGTWTASPQPPRGVHAGKASRTRPFARSSASALAAAKSGSGCRTSSAASRCRLGRPASDWPARVQKIVAGSLRPLTFGGAKKITLLPGAPALSDPVELNVAPLSDLAIDLYLPAATELATVHQVGLQTADVSAPGDFTASV